MQNRLDDEILNLNDVFTFRPHRPGDIGYIIYLHGVLYAREFGFDITFDFYVADAMAKFIKDFDSKREYLWIVETGSKIAGSIAIVKVDDEVAQLRWFILEPEFRGKGIGKKLVNEAVDFCKRAGYSKMILWTFDELDVAKGLYEYAGFHVVKKESHEMWGQNLTEELWEFEIII